MIEPCDRHRNAINGQNAVPWHRALQIADDCRFCTVTTP